MFWEDSCWSIVFPVVSRFVVGQLAEANDHQQTSYHLKWDFPAGWEFCCSATINHPLKYGRVNLETIQAGLTKYLPCAWGTLVKACGRETWRLTFDGWKLNRWEKQRRCVTLIRTVVIRRGLLVSGRQKQHSEMSLTAILSEIDGGDDKGVEKLLQKYNIEVKRLLLAYHLMLFYCALALEILAS